MDEQELELVFDRVDQTLEVLGQRPVERMITILEQRLALLEEGESELETKEVKDFLKEILGDVYFKIKDEKYALNFDWTFFEAVLEDYSRDIDEQNKLLVDYVIAKWNLQDCGDIAFHTMLARLYVKVGKTEKLVNLLNKFDPKTGRKSLLKMLLFKKGDPYANDRRLKLVDLYRVGIEFLAAQGATKRLKQWVSNMAKWDKKGKVPVGRVEIPADMFFDDLPGDKHRIKASTLEALLKYETEGKEDVLELLTRDAAEFIENILRRGRFDISSDELLYLNRVRKAMNLRTSDQIEELYITLMPINQKNRVVLDEKERRNRESIILWDRKRENLYNRYPELKHMDDFLEELNYPEFFEEGEESIEKVDDAKRKPEFEQNKVIIYLLTAIMDELIKE